MKTKDEQIKELERRIRNLISNNSYWRGKCKDAQNRANNLLERLNK